MNFIYPICKEMLMQTDLRLP